MNADKPAADKPGNVLADRRRTKFLTVVDDTPEARVALRFAASRAAKVGGGLAVLRVIQDGDDNQQWLAVAEAMREEAREEAERLLRDLASQVKELTGLVPEVIIREGSLRTELIRLITEDPDVRILVLGAAPGPDGPGPLVSALAGQMPGDFRIPVTVVPGKLTDQEIEELT